MSDTTYTRNKESGQLLVLVLVFGAVFLIIISSFISSVVSQARVVDVRFEQHRATEIAEAGLNYYKWYLAHYPDDVSGSGTYVYDDPEDGAIGTYELAITDSSYCGHISSIEVTSTGRTYVNPDALAIVSATYKRPTVAEYSFISNSGVWYDSTSVVTGPIHSNQGLRMEASHNSVVGSGQATWDCDSSYGCTPTVTGAPGVYSSGGVSTPGLFQYPVSPIDFAGITLDLSQMKASAQSDGIYYGPTAGYGYRVVFNGNSTIDVYRVTGTYNYYSYSSAEGTHPNGTYDGERNVITAETQIANDRLIDADCPVLFFEDKTWIEGDVNQKVALAAGLNTIDPQTNVVVNGDMTYVAGTNAGIVVIAEDDIDIGVEVPEDMLLHGIYIAQNGRYGRNYYHLNWFPASLDDDVMKNSLTTLGTAVSNQRAVTQWGSSGFVVDSGSFDRDQVDDPPPLTPTTNDVYELQDWRSEG